MTSYHVKQNKATGYYDLFLQSAMKLSTDVLCYPLSTLINYVLNNSKIPQQWKLSEVTPGFKKECSLDKSNYRPATILPSLSKVFASIVHADLVLILKTYICYHKYVFAYRKHCGCDTAILSLTERWKQELDNHKVIGVVSMDLSKVFDTLSHDLIVLN